MGAAEGMTVRAFGQLLAVVGGLGSAASVTYWYWFYLNVIRFLGERGTPPSEYLFTSNGPCGFVAGAA